MDAPKYSAIDLCQLWVSQLPSGLGERIAQLCAASSLEEAVVETAQFVSESDDIQSLSQSVMQKVVHAKSDRTAKQLREQGNTAFTTGDSAQAASIYTASLAFAETIEHQTVARLNRSTSLHKLHRQPEALKDAEWVLERDPTNIKALFRAANSSAAVGNMSDASAYIKRMKECGAAEKDIQQVRSRLKMPPSPPSSPPPSPRVVDGEIEEAGSFVNRGLRNAWWTTTAKNSIEVQDSKELGRHIVAVEPITAGSVLISEQPFAACVQVEASQEHCHYCFKYIPLTAVPCNRCAYGRYCNDTCRETDWKEHHQFECQKAFYGTVNDAARLAIRIVRTGWLTSHTIDQAEPVSPITKTDEQPTTADAPAVTMTETGDKKRSESFRNTTKADLSTDQWLVARRYQQICALQTHMNNQPSEALVRACIVGVIAEYCQIVPQGSGMSVSLHMLAIPSNAWAVSVFVNDGDSIEQRKAGLALYPAAAMLNHSCDPSATVWVNSRTLTARAARDLDPGAHVTHCYGPRAGKMSTKERRKALKEEYFFDCDCLACLQSKDYRDYQCQNCGGSVSPTAKICTHCQQPFDTESVKKDLQRAEQMLLLVEKMEKMENLPGAIKAAQTCVEIRSKVLTDTHIDLASARDTLARLHAQNLDYTSSIQVSLQSTATIGKISGLESVEYAHEALKIAQLYAADADIAQVQQWLSTAERLLRLHYGDSHPSRSDIAMLQQWLVMAQGAQKQQDSQSTRKR